MHYHGAEVDEVLRELETSENGLSKTEAARRLAKYGPNRITVRRTPLWKIIIEPFANVFMAVLIIAAIISFVQGEAIDGWIIVVIMLVSAVIDWVQRFSTERILRSLRQSDPLVVRVERDGELLELDAEDLVPGDTVQLGEGQRVPADARVIESHSLRVDESQLTGESLPIAKQTERIPQSSAVYERSNMIFRGSFVVGGEATAIVTGTAGSTEFGRIAALSAEESQFDESPVQRKIDRLLSKIVTLVGIAAGLAFVLALLRGVGVSESIRFVLALAVSAVPEGLPVAISVVIALGMRRMAKRKTLVRSMRALETLGILTTIATDKTGTLTKNKLSVIETWSPNASKKPLETALTRSIITGDSSFDPLDKAMQDCVRRQKLPKPRSEATKVLPFEQKSAMSGVVWLGSLYVKGSPERILARSRLDAETKKYAETTLGQFTAKGYRVIALAHTDDTSLKTLGELPQKDSLVFDGFIGIADVLRPEAKAAIATANKAGVTVRMITGDHPETAYHIGKQLGMVNDRSEVFDCTKLDDLDGSELRTTIERTKVFSRVIPEHKHRILNILKKHHITAMTGDGVNDVPALANANVGVAMGSGTSIAKDAGDIILIDDNFKRIVDAIHEGRTIFANIKRMLVYLLSTNLGEVLVSIGALIIGVPLPLVAVQLLWVNLVTDTSLVIPLGLEPGSRRNMLRKPYPPDAPLLSRFMTSRLFVVALAMAALTLGYFIYYLKVDSNYARTIAFSVLVVMQWGSALSNRSDYSPIWQRLRVPNPAFWIGLGVAVILQALALFTPLGKYLHVSPVDLSDLLIASGVAFFSIIIIIEIHKWIGRRFFDKGTTKLLKTV